MIISPVRKCESIAITYGIAIRLLMIIKERQIKDQNVSECVRVWCGTIGLNRKSRSGSMEAENRSGKEKHSETFFFSA